LFDFKITILSGMIPPLLIVIGIPNSIYMLNKFHHEYANHGNKIKALQRVIVRIGNATFLTNLTTASGFATFIIVKSDILKHCGILEYYEPFCAGSHSDSGSFQRYRAAFHEAHPAPGQ